MIIFLFFKDSPVLQEVLGRTNHLLSFHITDYIENDVFNNSSITACAFIATEMFTDPLPNNDRGINIKTHILPFDMIQAAQKMPCPTILLLNIFTAMGMCLLSTCPAMAMGRGIHLQIDNTADSKVIPCVYLCFFKIGRVS